MFKSNISDSTSCALTVLRQLQIAGSLPSVIMALILLGQADSLTFLPNILATHSWLGPRWVGGLAVSWIGGNRPLVHVILCTSCGTSRQDVFQLNTSDKPLWAAIVQDKAMILFSQVNAMVTGKLICQLLSIFSHYTRYNTPNFKIMICRNITHFNMF